MALPERFRPRTSPVADPAQVIRFENLIAQGGKLPINTAGGNLAQGFIHGIGLPIDPVAGDMNGLRIGTPELVRWGVTVADISTLLTGFGSMSANQRGENTAAFGNGVAGRVVFR